MYNSLRKRSATFPFGSSTSDLNICDFSDTSSNFSFDDKTFDDKTFDDFRNQMETPQKSHPSKADSIIPYDKTYNEIAQTINNRHKYSPTGESPVGHSYRTPIVDSSFGHTKPLCEEMPSSPFHNFNGTNWESSPQSSTMRSVFSNVASPLLPQMTYGMSLPVRQLLGYSHLYPVYSGNSYYERNNNWHNHYLNRSDQVEEMAKNHRNAATHADAKHIWSGTLPNNTSHKNPVYSCKVFLGGVPWEMSDHDIKMTFSRYGVVNVHRPGKEVRLSRSSQDKDKAGYLYLIFESDKQVKSLLNSCTHDFSNGGKYYYSLNQSRYRPKEVQVIPWNVYDSTYVKSQSARVDANKTVFVGALHGMLTAEGLACILEDLFGGVLYVGIDTDKYKYPIGSGRVTFSNSKAYTRAVHAAFIDVKSSRFQKKIQIDPFLEENNCSQCRTAKGPIFCRDACMKYLCRTCWDVLHSSDSMKRHQPLMRNKNKF